MSDTAIGRGEGVGVLVGFLMLLWTVNWVWWGVAGTPVPYCLVRERFGGLALQLHDGIRAILFVWCLGALCTGRLKYLVPALAVTAFNLMLPGFVVTLFSFGQACR